jgi:thiaminase/transcriptional activator TenA
MEAMTFTGQLWKDIGPIYAAIIDHPYNRELAAGTLPPETFKHYLKQDALYLLDFSRALAIVSARAHSAEQILLFLNFARDGLVVERALHQEYFARFGVTPDVDRSPACLAYTHYLLATASLGSFEEAVSALLPCFWIYREVGLTIVKASGAGNPYQLWIDTYAGEEFAEAVRRAIQATDQVAMATTGDERRRMAEAFTLSSRLEWMFWDSAYRREVWKP